MNMARFPVSDPHRRISKTLLLLFFSCDKQLLNYPLTVVVVLVLVVLVLVVLVLVVLVIYFHQSRKLLDGSRSFLYMFLLIHYNKRTQRGVSFHKLFLCVFRVLGGDLEIFTSGYTPRVFQHSFS